MRIPRIEEPTRQIRNRNEMKKEAALFLEMKKGRRGLQLWQGEAVVDQDAANQLNWAGKASFVCGLF